MSTFGLDPQRTMRAVSKVKLDLDPDPDVSVFGISCHVHDHRLCWAMNRALGFDLARRRSDITDEVAGRTARYSVFDHTDPHTEGRVILVHNHSPEGILIKEQRNADFLMLVDNELAERMPDLLDRLRKLEFVLAVFPLELEQMRLGHKLLE